MIAAAGIGYRVTEKQCCGKNTGVHTCRVSRLPHEAALHRRA